MTRNNEPSYREKGRSLFLAALMVMSVFAMSAAFAGSAAANHGDGNFSDGDRLWVGQEVTYSDSDITNAELQDGDGNFVTELPVYTENGVDHVDIDTTELDAGQYELTYDEDGGSPVEFEVSEQTLTIDAEDEVITDGGDTASTTFNVDSNRVGFEVDVTSDELSVEQLDTLFNHGQAVNEDGETTTADADDAEALRVDLENEDLSVDATDFETGNYTFNFDVVDTAASDSASLTIEEAGAGAVDFANSVTTVNEGDEVTFEVEFQNTNENAVLTIGDEDEVGFEVETTVINPSDSDVAEVTFDSSAPATGQNGLTIVSGDVDPVVVNDDHIDGETLDQGDYGMELAFESSPDRTQDIGTLVVGDQDAPAHEGTYVTGDDVSADADEIEATAGNVVAENDKLVVEYEDVGYTGAAQSGWGVLVEESNPGPNQKADVLQSGVDVHWDQDDRTVTAVIDTDTAGLEDGDVYDVRLLLDANENKYFDAEEHDEYTFTVEDEEGNEQEVTVNPVYNVEAQFEVTERTVDFTHEENEDGQFEIEQQDDGTITVEGEGTPADGTSYTVLLRSEEANELLTKDVELENGEFATEFDLSDYEPGFEFTLDIDSSDYDGDRQDAVLVAGEEPAEAEFDVSVDAPETVKVGDDASLDVTVENVGDAAGTYTVTATIDGEEVSQDVELKSGASTTVSFDFDTSEAGAIDWSVDGESGTLTVEEKKTDDSEEDDTEEDDTKEDDTEEDDTKEDDSTEDDSTEDDSEEEDGTPGFGVAVAAIALLAAAMLALRRQH